MARGEQAGAHAAGEPAEGDHVQGGHELVRAESAPELGVGAVQVGTGRISAARQPEDPRHGLPFSVPELARIDEALTFASRDTGVHFSVWLGALGGDSRDRAEELLRSRGGEADESVLIAVSPGERVVEVVTGKHVSRRVTDRGSRLAVMAMVSSFGSGDLVGGILSGLRMLADQAGHRTS